MNYFTDVVFKKYADFSGRASRKEYWMYVLIICVISLVLSLLAKITAGSGIDFLIKIVQFLFGLALIVPNVALGARRLHDTDRSGWWQLLAFIPIIGTIILLVWLIMKGTPGPNRFGADPRPSVMPPAAAPTPIS